MGLRIKDGDGCWIHLSHSYYGEKTCSDCRLDWVVLGKLLWKARSHFRIFA